MEQNNDKYRRDEEYKEEKQSRRQQKNIVERMSEWGMQMIHEKRNTCVDTAPKYTLPYLIIFYFLRILKSTLIVSPEHSATIDRNMDSARASACTHTQAITPYMKAEAVDFIELFPILIN